MKIVMIGSILLLLTLCSGCDSLPVREATKMVDNMADRECEPAEVTIGKTRIKIKCK